MYLPAETDLAVDLHDRNAVVEAGPVLGVSIDVDGLNRQTVRLEDLTGMVAQMAPLASIEHGGLDVGRGGGHGSGRSLGDQSLGDR
jgi:hypothetical protein